MQRNLLGLLACPECKARLVAEEVDVVVPAAARPDTVVRVGAGETAEVGGEDIRSAILRCTRCGFGYPVEEGIPNLLPPEFHVDGVLE